MTKLRWFIGGLSLLVAVYVGLGAARVEIPPPPVAIRELRPADLPVVELTLRRAGHRVQVEGGYLARRGPEVVAVLDCRSETGQMAFGWEYPLGRLDRQEALEEAGRLAQAETPRRNGK